MTRAALAVLIAAALCAGCASNDAGLAAAAGGLGGAEPAHADAEPVRSLTVANQRARQTWDARRTAEKYARGRMLEAAEVHLEEGTAVPAWTRPGGSLHALLQYAVVGAIPHVEVVETRRILRNGEPVAEVASGAHLRANGTWISSLDILLPVTMPRGDYTLEQTVAIHGVEHRAESVFTVGSR